MRRFPLDASERVVARCRGQSTLLQCRRVCRRWNAAAADPLKSFQLPINMIDALLRASKVNRNILGRLDSQSLETLRLVCHSACNAVDSAPEDWFPVCQRIRYSPPCLFTGVLELRADPMQTSWGSRGRDRKKKKSRGNKAQRRTGGPDPKSTKPLEFVTECDHCRKRVGHPLATPMDYVDWCPSRGKELLQRSPSEGCGPAFGVTFATRVDDYKLFETRRVALRVECDGCRQHLGRVSLAYKRRQEEERQKCEAFLTRQAELTRRKREAVELEIRETQKQERETELRRHEHEQTQRTLDSVFALALA